MGLAEQLVPLAEVRTAAQALARDHRHLRTASDSGDSQNHAW